MSKASHHSTSDHSITWCDRHHVLSSQHRESESVQRMRSRGEFHLLKTLGSSLKSYRNIKSAKRFYHTVMYNGKDDEIITDTRVLYYQNQKVKTSIYLISDERSIDQHMLRSDLQCLIWLQCTEQILPW